MGAVLYLFLSSIAGYFVVGKMVPYLSRLSKTRCLTGNLVKIKKWMIILPASFLTGTLLMTWVTYVAAYAFHKTSNPLLYGNLISFSIFAVISIYFIFVNRRKISNLLCNIKKNNRKKIIKILRENYTELIFVAVFLIVWSFFMFRSLFIKDGTINVGLSVFSDFGPHLAVIRSFSFGANFPTEYPHFAMGNIRYHFMFQFLAGNLEFLGLPLDWAFNLPSILSIVSFHMLLYSFVMLLFNRRSIAVLTSVFFFFRSSFAFFTFVKQFDSIGQAWNKILVNDLHIGKTMHEEWGLWAQKVYVNQRHFAFALGVLLIVLIALLPLLRKMIWSIRKAVKRSIDESKQVGISESETTVTLEDTLEDTVDRSPVKKSKALIMLNKIIKKFIYCLNEFAVSQDSWMPQDIGRSAVIGTVFGLLCFWNGAVVIAGLGILFIIALYSKHRLEFLNIAIITVLLSYIQSAFFVGAADSAVNPRLTIGFLSNSTELTGILKYYIELLGILPFVVAAGMLIVPKGGRWLTLAFISPIVLATLLQLTPDITVNHKYVIIGSILMGIIASYLIYRLFASRRIIAIIIASILAVVMTVTGAVDIITLYNLDKRRIEINTSDPLLVWTANHTGPNEIFLTEPYCLHPILLAGRKIFHGWPYFAWSAGYDTGMRAKTVERIYGGRNIDEVKKLIEENRISYIVIENGNRNNSDYKLNEDLIKNNFELVYKNQAQKFAIYRTY